MPEDIKELYERGTELFEKGDYVESEELLKKVININPRFADVHNKLGQIAHHNGRLRAAAEHFEAAVKENPRYTEACLNLAITLNDMGETDRAGELFDMLKTEMPENKGTLDPFAAGKLANEHFKIGNIYMDFNRYDDAIDEFRKALRLRPGLPDIHTKLGIALREKGLFDEAVSALTNARDSNPYYGPAWVQLGLTYYMDGLTGQAFEVWEQALQKLPNLKEAAVFLEIFKKR